MFIRLMRQSGAVCLLSGLLFSCRDTMRPAQPGRYYTGQFLGHAYTIDIVGDSVNYQNRIDSILEGVAGAFDLADTSSILSRYNRFNQTDRAFIFVDSTAVFGAVYDVMRDIHHSTGGLIDPTLNPIRRAWRERRQLGWNGEPDLDELFEYTGFDGAKVDLNEKTGDDGYSYLESHMRKADPRIELDYTVYAGAFAMDRISSLFQELEVPQWRITYDRGIIAYGAFSDSLTKVSLGISGDSTDQQIRLPGKAFAYQTIKEKEQMIDPTHGYPIVDNEMLYSGVAAPTLLEAVAFSEAFMIMGLADASEWYEEHPDSRIDSFLLFRRDEEISSASTAGFDALFVVPDSTAIQP